MNAPVNIVFQNEGNSTSTNNDSTVTPTVGVVDDTGMSSGGLSTGVLVGITAGGSAGLFILCCVCFCVIRAMKVGCRANVSDREGLCGKRQRLCLR